MNVRESKRFSSNFFRFRWNKGPCYTALTAKFYALLDETISDQATFLKKCSNLPLELQLYYKYVEHMPDQWPIETHGAFPDGGIGNHCLLLFIYCNKYT